MIPGTGDRPSGTVLADGISLVDAVGVVADSLVSGGLCFGHGTDDAAGEAEWLVLWACGMTPAEPAVPWERRLSKNERVTISSLLDRRIRSRRPLAYLLGEAWFAGYRFTVDERVLVPRSYFAEWIPDRFEPWIEPGNIHSILDLCCGSGCIGIAAAMAFPRARVLLSDLSADALAVAERNVLRHGVSDRVEINQGDRFEGIARRFDLILCNPPYVSGSRMDTLPPEYLAEPRLGLEAGEDGLDFIAPLLESARDYLNPGGSLMVEAGSAGQAVLDRWPSVPFTWLATRNDDQVLFMLRIEELARHGF
ncbi:MAG: 50S ribosomal protein L3 N(5)-glutamine methyltransferase [Gammaproteobacteria bacterium]|nr:50S ribosomal protein L3 N(5)-glutamine methyltransferase [Gammaproteobacteria bacterium]MYG65407.1 50S ribosomal protein L3 N(5)-glutamine methyltransferase [Gammaproteobacteria bacterium]